MGFKYVHPDISGSETSATYADFQALVTQLGHTRLRSVFYQLHRVWVVFEDGIVVATEWSGNAPATDFPDAISVSVDLVFDAGNPF